MSEVHEMHGVAAEPSMIAEERGWVRIYDKHNAVMLAMSGDTPHLTPAACRYLASKLRRLAKIVEERQA